MRWIFVDRFRGFQETLLPIKDVNFFVGENSSGKTSLLALLQLFHSVNFWAAGRFVSGERESGYIDLGDYEDIVSMHAKDKKCFHVGGLFNSGKELGDEYTAFLMTFSEDLGMPRIRRYTLVKDRRKADVEFKGRRVFYKIGEAETIPGEKVSVRDLFIQWSREHEEETSGLRELRSWMSISNVATVNAIIEPMMEGDDSAVEEGTLAMAYPGFYRNLTWLAPIRAKPEPIYTGSETGFSPEGDHTPYSIKRLLESKARAMEFKRFIGEFGKESGLFDSVEIKKYRAGRQKIVPFEVDIVLSGKATKITNVGYGVSQALPVIVELFEERKGSAFIIQQPEIHLHPKAQGALGDLFFNLAVVDNKQFLVETHSDFIIDRFRMNFRGKKRKQKPQSQVVYFENSSEGNTLNVLDIDEEGNLPEKQPEGYREFFLKEDLRVLGY